MSFILIAFATDEGQTAKIAGALADRLKAVGHTVRLSDLERRDGWADPGTHDAAIVRSHIAP